MDVPMSLTESQEQILDAAMQCISRDGIDGASMRSVAREADVSLGLLSYHFDGKEDLIQAAFQLACDRVYEVTLAAVDASHDPIDQVRNYVRGPFHDDFLADDYLALRIGLWAIARTDDAIATVEKSLYERYIDRLVPLIQAFDSTVSATEGRNRATDVVVRQNGLWLNWARYKDPADLERGLSQCEELALGQPN